MSKLCIGFWDAGMKSIDLMFVKIIALVHYYLSTKVDASSGPSDCVKHPIFKSTKTL